MKGEDSSISRRVEELRKAFDESFSIAYRAGGESSEDFVAIRVAGNPYAFRLAEISEIFTGKQVVRLPGSDAGLLGVAGFRGTLVPIYDLGALLGYSRLAQPQWGIRIRHSSPVGVAFDSFEAYLRVSRGETLSNAGTLSVIDVPSILIEIEERAHGPQKG